MERLDISELSQEFGELSIEERNQNFDFLQFAEQVMEPFGCSVCLKRFEPVSLPALYTLNSESGFLRSVDQSKEVSDELWDSILDSVAAPKEDLAKAQLCLNFDNPVVVKLAALSDRDLLAEAIKMLYVQSLLLGHYPLRSLETNVLSEGLINLIEAAVKPK